MNLPLTPLPTKALPTKREPTELERIRNQWSLANWEVELLRWRQAHVRPWGVCGACGGAIESTSPRVTPSSVPEGGSEGA